MQEQSPVDQIKPDQRTVVVSARDRRYYPFWDENHAYIGPGFTEFEAARRSMIVLQGSGELPTTGVRIAVGFNVEVTE
jgi:hypothetical protein